jgi:hypothetical protein
MKNGKSRAGRVWRSPRSFRASRGDNHATDAGAAAFGASATSVSFVDAVDALVPGDVGGAVIFGDSLVDGYENVGLAGGEDQAGIDANHRLPDDLAQRLLGQPGGPGLSVVARGSAATSCSPMRTRRWPGRAASPAWMLPSSGWRG